MSNAHFVGKSWPRVYNILSQRSKIDNVRCIFRSGFYRIPRLDGRDVTAGNRMQERMRY